MKEKIKKVVMQREIKFRAWDLISNVMHKWEDYAPCSDIFNEPDCILLQYTGLKDKNGKKIYEDDVIKWNDHNWRITYGRRGKLNSAGYYADGGGSTFYVFGNLSGGMEIVGNIYENPELLKVRKTLKYKQKSGNEKEK